MALENTDSEWRNEAPGLSAINSGSPFTVPEGYFVGLEQTIKTRCLIENERFGEEEEFELPEGYFESLSSVIQSRIAEENLRELVQADGFAVPQGYFTALERRILAKTSEEVLPEIRNIRPVRSNWIRYAAAACVTLVLGSVLVFNNQNNNIDSQLGQIPDEEIINYLQVNSDMGDTPLIMEGLSESSGINDMGDHLSEADLEDYINTTL